MREYRPIDTNHAEGYDNGPARRFESRFPTTEAIVQEQTIRRLNREYNREQEEKRKAIRTLLFCVVMVAFGVAVVALPQLYAWWRLGK